MPTAGADSTARPRPRALHGRAFRSPCVTLLLLMVSLCLGRPMAAQAPLQPPSQNDLEAVYLYNFAKFVRWPQGNPGAAVNICVVARKEFVDDLTKVVAGESIGSRPLTVRVVERPEDEPSCNLLFMDFSAKERLGGLLAGASGRPILTVSDIPGFLEKGGMIQFVVVNNRVRFAVDLRPAAQGGLSLSSELLKVAITVNGSPAGGGKP